MSFSHLSGIITQSGTDTDLSGLVALVGSGAGVNVNAWDSYTVYSIASSKELVITGTLTINPPPREVVRDSNGNIAGVR
jgi:hypothetical protein